MNKDTQIGTAAVSLGNLEAGFEEALEDADHVVYISLARGLSSSCKNAQMIAREEKFAGKVTVIDSDFITP
jgi:fatty acid-binding protein DegV